MNWILNEKVILKMLRIIAEWIWYRNVNEDYKLVSGNVLLSNVATWSVNDVSDNILKLISFPV